MISVAISTAQVIGRLKDYQAEQQARVRLACVEIAGLLEQYAIQNHPWSVETGATNVTTRGTWQQLGGDLYEIVLSAGMDYDVYLEGGTEKTGYTFMDAVRQGRWAWLWPDLIANRDEIISIFARHMAH